MRRAITALGAAFLLAGCEGQAKLPASSGCTSGQVDTQTDPQNCGSCGNVCPAPAFLHGVAICSQGVCGAQCEPGWLDLEPTAMGCETSLVVAIPSSSTSLLQFEQSSPTHRNQAILAEPTPAAVGGAVEQTDGEHRNVPGANAMFQ